MESLLAATESKDENAIINALEKVKEIPKKIKKTQSATDPNTKSVNLGRKATKPAGGFGEDADETPNKIQKTEATKIEEDEEPLDEVFDCINCGS